jgi:hypothetical protein
MAPYHIIALGMIVRHAPMTPGETYSLSLVDASADASLLTEPISRAIAK